RNIGKFVTSSLEVVATFVGLILLSFELTIVALLVLPPMFGIWGRIRKRLLRADRGVLNLAGEVSSHLQETVSGVRLVKAAAAEDYERKRFRALTWRYYKSFVRAERLRLTVSPLTEMMSAFGTVLLLWYGTRMVLVEQEIDATAFIAFLGMSLKL